MTWNDIKQSGRPYYETILHGSLCRFYQHENGGWSCRISTGGGLTIMHESVKKTLWNAARAYARRLATDPAIKTADRPRYTDADIRRYNGTPNVCRTTA